MNTLIVILVVALVYSIALLRDIKSTSDRIASKFTEISARQRTEKLK